MVEIVHTQSGQLSRRIVFASCLLAFAACATLEAAPQAMPGSFSAISVTDPNVRAAARFAIEAERQALSMVGESAALELISILSAEEQVVAGANYRLGLRVSRNGKPQDAEALVWWQAWRTPAPYQLTSWQWR